MSRGSWSSVPFLTAVSDESRGHAKIKKADYQSVGKLAVVDQGQGLIGGFTDEEASVSHVDLPAIIFGDHTRAVKYVDFPFAVGADGVKVLRPSLGVDARYLYRYMQTLKITDGGYSRHFKYLKEVEVPLPPIEEQRRIAAVLDAADELRAKRRDALARLDALTQAIFIDLFGGPARLLDAWPSSALQDLVEEGTSVTYGIVQAGDEWPGGVPYIRTGDIVDGRILTDGLRHTDPEVAERFERSKVRAGDLVMSIRATVGTVARVPQQLEGANLTQGTARIAPGERLDAVYLLQYLQSPAAQRWIARQVKGATFREITLGRLRELPVPVPPPSLQARFATRVAAIEEAMGSMTSSSGALEHMFGALQQRAFRGEL